MSLQIICPLPANLSQIVATTCAQHFGQIVRIAFERVADGDFDGTPTNDLTVEADWDTRIAADQITISDFSENVVIPAGEAITEGGDDNSTLYGQSLVVGKGQVTVEGRFRGITAASKASYEQFVSEASVFNQLSVYLINEFGQLIVLDAANVDPDVGTGFPVQSFFISDVDSQGYNTHNMNNFQWNFVGGWSDGFKIVDLTWDILAK